MSLWIKHANIATMDETCPAASSAVVIDEYFAYVGDEAGAAAFLQEHPQQELREIDCGGQFLLPGFNDSHMHYMHYVKTKMGAELFSCTSMADLVQRMKDYFENRYDKTPACGWWAKAGTRTASPMKSVSPPTGIWMPSPPNIPFW